MEGTGGCTGGASGMAGGGQGAGGAGGPPSAMFTYNMKCAAKVFIPTLALI